MESAGGIVLDIVSHWYWTFSAMRSGATDPMSGDRNKIMKNFLRVLALIAGAGLILAGSNTAPDLPTSSTMSVDVIVQYKTAPTQSE